MCVVCCPGSKADAQPRNGVRSVASAVPSCQRRRKASNTMPGLLDSFPGAVAPAPATFSDSTTAECRARAATRWVHGRARQHCPESGVEVSDQFGFVSESGQFRMATWGENWPVSRLMPMAWPGGAARPIADVLPGRSLAGYCWCWPDGVSRPPESSGAHDVLLTVSAVCGRRNERKHPA